MLSCPKIWNDEIDKNVGVVPFFNPFHLPVAFFARILNSTLYRLRGS